jgi:hypothetical protein
VPPPPERIKVANIDGSGAQFDLFPDWQRLP